MTGFSYHHLRLVSRWWSLLDNMTPRYNFTWHRNIKSPRGQCIQYGFSGPWPRGVQDGQGPVGWQHTPKSILNWDPRHCQARLSTIQRRPPRTLSKLIKLFTFVRLKNSRYLVLFKFDYCQIVFVTKLINVTDLQAFARTLFIYHEWEPTREGPLKDTKFGVAGIHHVCQCAQQNIHTSGHAWITRTSFFHSLTFSLAH